MKKGLGGVGSLLCPLVSGVPIYQNGFGHENLCMAGFKARNSIRYRKRASMLFVRQVLKARAYYVLLFA